VDITSAVYYPGVRDSGLRSTATTVLAKKLPRKPSTQNLYSDPEGIHSYSLSNKIDPRFAPAIVISSGEVFKIKIAG
jgi:hypothetical protein